MLVAAGRITEQELFQIALNRGIQDAREIKGDPYYRNGKVDALEAVKRYTEAKGTPTIEVMDQGIAHWKHRISSGGPLAYCQGNLDAYNEVRDIIKAEG